MLELFLWDGFEGSRTWSAGGMEEAGMGGGSVQLGEVVRALLGR